MIHNIFILLSFLCTVSSVCMNDWVRYEDSCYYFAHLPADKVTWHQAVQACSWNESRLVTVETKGEHDFIKRHLTELTPGSEEQFWTFGNDIFKENTWNWGEAYNPITTTYWYPGQPSNGGRPGVEDCLAYYARLHFDWNDESCSSIEYYICEVACNKHAATQMHVCPTCGKTFSTDSDLKAHKKREKNRRTFCCDICNHHALPRFELNEHMHSHAEDRSMACRHCGAKNKHRSSLNGHISQRHRLH